MSLHLTIDGPALRAPMTVLITQPRVTLGRASTCDVRLPFATISSHHLTLERDARGQYTISDAGSTNGTTLDGKPLAPGQPAPLRHGAALAILDLRITVELSRALDQGFTLAESGTMVRQMVSQALQQAEGSSDQAFFEVIRGRDRGRRFLVPDDLDEGRIGRGADALVALSEAVPEHLATLKRQGDGFTVTPTGALALLLDGSPLDGPRPLRSRQRLSFADVECLFFDPLQEYLEELEGGAPSPSASSAAREPAAAAQSAAQPAGRPAGQTTQPPGASTRQESTDPAPLSAPASAPAGQGSATDSVELLPKPGQAGQPGASGSPKRSGWSPVEMIMLVLTGLFILGGVGVLLIFLEVL